MQFNARIADLRADGSFRGLSGARSRGHPRTANSFSRLDGPAQVIESCE